MKTWKALRKWMKGYELEAGDLRRLDALWFEVKCVLLTIFVVIILLLFLDVVGIFEGKEQWRYKKY